MVAEEYLEGMDHNISSRCAHQCGVEELVMSIEVVEMG